MNKMLLASALTALVFLTACGGGGSDTSARDKTAPVITINGDTTVTSEAGSSYADSGATATDNADGDITAQIAVDNPVDNTSLGSYTVTYNVTDAAGNEATQKTRIVNVLDTTAPTITLIGEKTVTVIANSEYVDAGAIATDSYEGSLTPIASSNVDTSNLGLYVVTYNVYDSSGNAATPIVRTVIVKDTVDSSLIPPQAPTL
jgi:hypothetical protein